MASETGICNRALQILGAGRIVSLSELNSKAARECAVAYGPLRDARLRAHPWNFAVTRVQLAEDVDPPAFGFSHQFSLPADALRVLLPNDQDNDWVVEGQKILTNFPAPLNVRYIKQVVDANLMDPLFRETLSAKIADQICEAMTGSNAKRALARDAYDVAMAEASRTGGFEKVPELFREATWVTAGDN